MIEQATEAAKQWAVEIAGRHHGPNTPSDFRAMYDSRERNAAGLRGAMATLEYSLFVVAFVHYRSNGDLRSKVGEASMMSRIEIGRRNYYDKLDRVHYFIAGYLAATNGAAA